MNRSLDSSFSLRVSVCFSECVPAARLGHDRLLPPHLPPLEQSGLSLLQKLKVENRVLEVEVENLLAMVTKMKKVEEERIPPSGTVNEEFLRCLALIRLKDLSPISILFSICHKAEMY